MSERPNPDELLRTLAKETQADTKKGKLKIFFGYAAGVGKTFTMLKAAHAAMASGVEVVAGYIEPHTRPETLALLEGLETLPPLEVSYKGITLREFDLDGALMRHPHTILVDELAHQNAESCRHRKRYQDIQELLNAGIDVFTTVNVQHIESLNDIVASITGVIVHERVPDSIFDSADQVELVDIEPDDLINRLNQGKIYRQKQAQKALSNFFVSDNLVALREIALRRTADRVNRHAGKNAGDADKTGYYTEEHILICLSSSPSNAKVIRTAARMAEAFRGAFTALFVQTPNTTELTGENQNRLRTNLRLAEQLGAKIATVYGDEVASQIAEYAKISNVSKIIIGRSNNKKYRFLPTQSLVEQLTQLAPNLDVYVIPDNQPPYVNKKKKAKQKIAFSTIDTLKAVGILAVASLIGLWFYYLGFSEANIITLYLLGVLLTSIFTNGRIYSAASSIISVLIFNYLFTVPRFSLQAYDKGYPVTFLVMFIAAFVVSSLTTRVKAQARQSAQKAYRTQVLLETSQMLQQAANTNDIFRVTALQMQKLLGRMILFYPFKNSQMESPLIFAADNSTIGDYLAPDEQAVAQWVYKNNKHAGATTDTLPGSRGLYLAVRGHEHVFAVAAIAMDGGEGVLDVFEKNLLLSMLGECGLALEQATLTEAKKEVEVKAQQEQLRANLLRAISHDLRTPLTGISGNAGILMGNSSALAEDKKQQLYIDIFDDSMWLINLVENLLAVTRIDNGSMSIRMVPELLDEVIQEAMLHLNRQRSEHNITVSLEDDLLMAKMDSRLIIQVLINIIDNAIKYTPVGSDINVSAFRKGAFVQVEIADNGNGIDGDAKAKLFDMFYTADNDLGDGRRGLGLGLSLCKSIITAHEGRIWARNNLPHGTIFSFTLQAQEVTINE